MKNLNTVADVYKYSLDIFKDKSRWAQGYYQFDKEGKECGLEDAHSFCALGVLQHVTYSEEFFQANEDLRTQAQCLLQRVSEHLYGGEFIQGVNDGNDPVTAYNKVIAAFDFAYNLWKNEVPTLNDLSLSVKDLLARRKSNG